MSRRFEHLNSGSVLGGLVETEISTLQELAVSIPQERIEQAARMLIDTDTIYIRSRKFDAVG